MSWIEKLKTKWNLKSGKQVVIILIVFACTGTTVLLLKRPLFAYFTINGELDTWFLVIYCLMILPSYNIILLFYGFVFGQFEFFWAYEKRTIRRITGRKVNAEQRGSD